MTDRIVINTGPLVLLARADLLDVVGEHPVWAENHFSRPRDLLNDQIGHRFRRQRFALYEDSMKFIFSSDGKQNT